MKKVLIIRTDYLFVNQTFCTYDINIKYQGLQVAKTLKPGDRLPLPNNFNRCKF